MPKTKKLIYGDDHEEDENEVAHCKKYSINEKLLLVSIIHEHRRIIANIRTDAVSELEKKSAWRDIHNKYNEHALKEKYLQRTQESLFNCWKNIKAKCRKYDSGTKQHNLKGTGGGPPLPELKEEEEVLLEMARAIQPTLDFTLENQFDSTGQLEDSQEVLMCDDDSIEVVETEQNSFQLNTAAFIASSNIAISKNICNASSVSKDLVSKITLPSKQVSMSKNLPQKSSIVIQDENNILSTERTPLQVLSANTNPLKRSFLKITTKPTDMNQSNSFKASCPNILKHQSEITPGKSNLIFQQPNSGLTGTTKVALTKKSFLNNRIDKCKVFSEESIRQKTEKIPSGADIEQDIRIHKLTDSISQQEEIHKKKLLAVTTEFQYWQIKTETASIEKESALQKKLSANFKAKYWELKYKEASNIEFE